MVNEMRTFFFLLIAGMLIAQLSACQSIQAEQFTESIKDPILSNKQKLSTFDLDINRILNLIGQADFAGARQHLPLLKKTAKNSDQKCLLAYTETKLLLAENNVDSAYTALNSPDIARHTALSDINTQIYTSILNIDILTKKNLLPEAVKSRVNLARLITGTNLYQDNHNNIWSTLNKLAYSDIEILHQNDTTTDLHGWIELNTIYRDKKISLEDKTVFINNWYVHNPQHPASINRINFLDSLDTSNIKTKEKFAILLPLTGKYSSIGQAIKDGFMHSYFEHESNADIQFYDVGENDQFLIRYNQAVNEGSTLIIGPLFKNQLEELYSQDSLPVTTIALNKVEIAKKPGRLFQFSMAPEDEIATIIEQCKEAKFKNAFIIAQKDEYSQKNMATFIHLWEQLDNHIVGIHSFSDATNIGNELEKPLNINSSVFRSDNIKNILGVPLEQTAKSRTDIDIVLLLTKTENAQDISPLLKSYLPNNIAIYSTSAIYRGYPNSQIDSVLNDIIFTDIPLAITPMTKLSNKYIHSPLIRMHAFGIDTFNISKNLPLMIQKPDFYFEGATGKLSLETGDITRIPALGFFSNGKVQAMPSMAK